MEMSAIEIINPEHDNDDFNEAILQSRLTIEIHESTHSDEDSAPSLLAVTDDSSDDSTIPEDQFKVVEVPYRGSLKKKTDKKCQPPRHGNSIDCVADSFVGFLCPFDQAALSRRSCSGNETFDALTVCTDLYMFKANQEADTDWLSPLQSCIPEQWGKLAPDGYTRDGRRIIQNRVSAQKRSQRKQAYVEGLRHRWHSDDVGVPIRKARSWAYSKDNDSTEKAEYYDSDPGTDWDSPANPHGRSKQAAPSSRIRPSLTGDNEHFPFRALPHAVSAVEFSHWNKYSGPTEPDFTDDGDVREFIQEATQGQVGLIWHRPTYDIPADSSKILSLPPLSVTGWFEYGSQLDTTVVFPKFAWRPTFQPGLGRKKLSATHKGLDSIQLLTVVRVIVPKSLNRRLYPFARLDRSCCIITHDGSEFVFESPSTHHRDWFVARFKVLVARLASSVIVHDEAMLREFFSPCAHFPSAVHSYR